jgi:hypothetical protein
MGKFNVEDKVTIVGGTKGWCETVGPRGGRVEEWSETLNYLKNVKAEILSVDCGTKYILGVSGVELKFVFDLAGTSTGIKFNACGLVRGWKDIKKEKTLEKKLLMQQMLFLEILLQ